MLETGQSHVKRRITEVTLERQVYAVLLEMAQQSLPAIKRLPAFPAFRNLVHVVVVAFRVDVLVRSSGRSRPRNSRRDLDCWAVESRVSWGSWPGSDRCWKCSSAAETKKSTPRLDGTRRLPTQRLLPPGQCSRQSSSPTRCCPPRSSRRRPYSHLPRPRRHPPLNITKKSAVSNYCIFFPYKITAKITWITRSNQASFLPPNYFYAETRPLTLEPHTACRKGNLEI